MGNIQKQNVFMLKKIIRFLLYPFGYDYIDWWECPVCHSSAGIGYKVYRNRAWCNECGYHGYKGNFKHKILVKIRH